MYNDKIDQFDRRRAMVRRPCTPSALSDENEPMRIPSLDDDMGGRLCDGSMPQRIDRKTGWGLSEHPLAMVYSPYQEWRNAYTPEVALTRGTLFAELDLPFEGYKRNGGCC